MQTIRNPQSAIPSLADCYPNTVAAFSTMPGGDRALQAVIDLEHKWIHLNTYEGGAQSPLVTLPSAADLPRATHNTSYYDVIIAGGGLGLIAGVALARRGLRVLLFDRDRAGSAHREWNISERELSSLTRRGIFSPQEIASAVATRYSRGRIAFDPTGTGVPA